MNNKTLISVAVIIITLALGSYLLYSINNDRKVKLNDDNATTTVVYTNTDFGFNYNLPVNWKGYTIVNDKWIGTSLTTGTTTQTGPKLLIRNPKWTEAAPYEDLPILIFTITQWNSYLAQEYAVGAAPIQASELGRNNKYVFALPARWDFDYSLDFKEAEDIFAQDPLHPFN